MQGLWVKRGLVPVMLYFFAAKCTCLLSLAVIQVHFFFTNLISYTRGFCVKAE